VELEEINKVETTFLKLSWCEIDKTQEKAQTQRKGEKASVKDACSHVEPCVDVYIHSI
jgi:hypothetical protein